MRWFGTYLLLVTMAAYAAGLPVRMHEAEHARAARACCAWEMLPMFRLGRSGSEGNVPMPCKSAPEKQGCAMCIQLQGMIAAAAAPIVPLDSGAWVAGVELMVESQRGQAVAGRAACRGPPGRA